MARTTKPGIDYFPLDVNFDNDLKMYLIEHEAIGLAVWIVLLQHIYRNKGYYIEFNNDLTLLIKKEINVDINSINACINTLIVRNIFNKELFDKYEILTSRGIQKRYFEAAKRKKAVEAINEYVLIDISNYNNIINVNINSINVNNNSINVQNPCKNDTKEKEKEKVNVNKNKNNIYAQRFNEFWKAYPKKRAKGKAEKVWNKIKPDKNLFNKIMSSLEIAKKSEDWTKNNGQFIPYPATWLNAKGWEDEYEKDKKSFFDEL